MGAEDYTNSLNKPYDGRRDSDCTNSSGELDYKGNDPNCIACCRIYNKAVKYHLFDLQHAMTEVVQAIHTKKPKSLVDAASNLFGGLKSLTSEEATLLLTRKIVSIEQMLKAYEDPEEAKKLATDDELSQGVCEMLGPPANFDQCHKLHQMSMQIMSFGTEDRTKTKAWEEFLNKNSLEKNYRRKEEGFAQAQERAKNLMDPDEADKLGEKAWDSGRLWAAEMYWKRATEVGRHAKYWTNLAMVRIRLGRLMRSRETGFREAATGLIEMGMENAKRAAEIDPTYECSYYRWAEALMAIGPYDRAMDACKVLSEFPDERSSPPMLELKSLAKASARRWLLVANRSPKSIPGTIYAALLELRRAVVESLPVSKLDRLQTERIVGRVIDATWAVRGALEIIYLRLTQWEAEKQLEGDYVITDMVDVERQLRLISKIFPLDLIEISTEVRDLVFLREPWTMWGMDRLDRNGVMHLPFDAEDPLHQEENIIGVCQNDPSAVFADMAPPHFGAFSLGILERMIRSHPSGDPMSQAACQQIIDFYSAPSGVPQWSGGRFLPMCLVCAGGVGKFGMPKDEERTREFFGHEGGIAAMCKETSNDEQECFAQTIASITAEQWATASAFDVVEALRQYLLKVLDGDHDVPTDISSPHVSKSLSALLDGVHELPAFLRTAAEKMNDSNATTLRQCPDVNEVLRESKFGIFLVERFGIYEDLVKECTQRSSLESYKDVVRIMIEKWEELSYKERCDRQYKDASREELHQEILSALQANTSADK